MDSEPTIIRSTRHVPAGLDDSRRAQVAHDTIDNRAARSRPARASHSLLTPGVVLNGTYEIRRSLGRGGMGEVFEAHDRLLNRTVAIKLPWPHIEFDLLVQEAQALAALRGRGVPAVYAINRHGALGYCAMERLYGRTLSAYMVQRFSDGHFAVDEVVEILIGVADALACVHEAGLIHRDLKPSNIMLAPGNRTVLFDFGLFLTESNASSDRRICGSPRYIAPEVITATLTGGQAHLIDVYALGIIAFMLLTGMAPFDDPSVTGLLAKHVTKQPPRLAAIRPGVPPGLTRIIRDMLAKEPEERTFSATAVATSLRAVQDELRARESARPRGMPARRSATGATGKRH